MSLRNFGQTASMLRGLCLGAISLAWTLDAAAQLSSTLFSPSMVDEFGGAALTGAGSTFAQPLLAQWSRDYQHQRLGGVSEIAPNGGLDSDITVRQLDYESIGSLAGIERLKSGSVDFAVSERPLSTADLRKSGLLQIPLVLGGVAIAVNIPELDETALKLSGQVLADIYLGNIRRWNAAPLAQLNPGITLPDAEIMVIHRNDGSGTTFTFTGYLSMLDAAWRQQVGHDISVTWPTGLGYRGNEGVAAAIADNPYAIGYLNAVEAGQAELDVALLQNAAGTFVLPSQSAVQAAAVSATWERAKDYEQLLVNAPGAESYPLVATVYGLFPADGENTRVLSFFDWALSAGRTHAERLGYTPIPVDLTDAIRDELANLPD